MTTRTRRWWTMGRTFRTMSTQALSEFTAVDARTSLGNRESDPPFSRGLGPRISRFPIPDRPGTGNRETGRFPIRPGTGNRGPNSASRGFPGLGLSMNHRTILSKGHGSGDSGPKVSSVNTKQQSRLKYSQSLMSVSSHNGPKQPKAGSDRHLHWRCGC